jgi:DHA2 family multidrug resistance protein
VCSSDLWLAEHANPYNLMLQMPNVARAWSLTTRAGLSALDAEINRQAQMIAYIDVFKLLMIITAAMIPLILLLRNPKRAVAGADPHGAVPD